MLKSYLKVALRNLRKQKVVSVVTIGSLAVGLACCLLLFLYVRHEWSYDRFHEDAGRLFRVVNEQEKPGGAQALNAQLPVRVGPVLAEALPAVEAEIRFRKRAMTLSRPGGETFEDVPVTLADSSVFEVFSGFRLQRGDERTALDRPGSVVLSQQAARKYFGGENPLGQRLRVAFSKDTLAATVTGVAAPLPEGSSIPFEVVLPFENVRKDFSASMWKAIGNKLPLANTYVRLSAHAESGQTAERIADLMAKRSGGENEIFMSGQNRSTGYRLQPLAEVHLSPEVQGGLVPPGNPLYSYALAGIALLVLGLACINFMTLSLGRSAGRAREVGIRKTVGAQREQVAFQFWGEAVLTTGVALVLGVALARLGLPVFNRLMEQDLTLDLFGSPSLWLVLGGLVVVIGLVAGGYPALVVSGFAPASVLRGERAGPGGRSRLARGLVAVQFALAIALLAGVLVIARQIGYMTEHSLNFDADQVVRVNAQAGALTGASGAAGPSFYDRFRTEALRRSGVEAVAGSFATFPGGGIADELQLGDTASVRAYYNGVSKNFRGVMQVEQVAGHGFAEGTPSGNAQPVLVNRALVRAMGWPSPEAALGKTLPLKVTLTSKKESGVEIVGVLQDFHFQPLREQIKPLVFAPLEQMPSLSQWIYVRFRPGQTAAVLASLKDVWHRTASADEAFEYEFLDDVVREQYAAEHRWQALVRYAAGLALLISCAGLFGLALLSVQRREKEIGIRKVMGASALDVTALVARQFALLVAAGFVLAVLPAWLAARRWLQTFAYRIDLGAGPFLLAGLAVLTVAMATVGYQALRAARANPIDAIRNE